MANYSDPTSRPEDPGVEQPDPPLGEALSDPRLGEAGPTTGTFAASEMEYPRTGRSGEQYGQAVSYGSEEDSTVEIAKSEAANIKDTTVGAASGVKDVAKGEVSNVAGEAKYQARNLVDQTRSELRGQASNQQSQLAAKLNSWATELGSMASRSDDSGPMTDLAQQASRRVGEISHWLDNHEPADLLDEVKRFARRRPGTFLALAAAAGVLAGRLTRGAVAANTSVDSDDTDVTPARAYDSGSYDGGSYGGGSYDRDAYDRDAYDRGGYDSGLQGGGAYGTRTYQSSGYDPRYGEVEGETSYQGGGMPAAPEQYATSPEVPGQYPERAAPAPGEYPTSGPAYPDVTPTTEETYYPPPEGEVRR